MTIEMKREALKQLQEIPGVGKSIAEDLWQLGIRKVTDLKGKDAEHLYLKRCIQQGVTIDRCMLYTFRCAVYYASNKRHNPKLLKWWNWKD